MRKQKIGGKLQGKILQTKNQGKSSWGKICNRIWVIFSHIPLESFKHLAVHITVATIITLFHN